MTTASTPPSGSNSSTISPHTIASVEELFTRERAEEGVLLPITLPDGTETSCWLRVRSSLARSYRKLQFAIMREIAALEEKTDAASQEKAEELNLRLVAGLVIGWNLPLEFTPDNVYHVLFEAPQLASEVDRVGGRRAVFFGMKPFGSSSGPATSSG